jgi:hypothetical protein
MALTGILLCKAFSNLMCPYFQKIWYQLALSRLPSWDETVRQIAQDALTDAQDIFQRAEYFAPHGRA